MEIIWVSSLLAVGEAYEWCRGQCFIPWATSARCHANSRTADKYALFYIFLVFFDVIFRATQATKWETSGDFEGETTFTARITGINTRFMIWFMNFFIFVCSFWCFYDLIFTWSDIRRLKLMRNEIHMIDIRSLWLRLWCVRCNRWQRMKRRKSLRNLRLNVCFICFFMFFIVQCWICDPFYALWCVLWSILWCVSGKVEMLVGEMRELRMALAVKGGQSVSSAPASILSNKPKRIHFLFSSFFMSF